MINNNGIKRLTNISLLFVFILLCCNKGSSTKKILIKFQGEKRTCIIEKSDNSILNQPPLLIILHGNNESADFIKYRIKNSNVFTKSGMLVVYPNGSGFMRHNWDDFKTQIDFINTIIDSFSIKFKIDTTKIYIAGFSQGGMLAYRMACEHSERIAAIAMVSSQIDSNYVNNNCILQRAVPLISINSKVDSACPYDSFTYKGKWFNSVQSGVSAWANKSGCNIEADSIYHGNNYEVNIWKKDNQEITILWTLKNGGHAWPQGRGLLYIKHFEPSKIINANEIIWNFISNKSIDVK
jgi:polyhydroxybutyrate depolymerase